MSYEPYGKTRKVLDRAMEHIKSVDYAVSVRWVFYRLLQDGFYTKKADYNNLVSLTSRARKEWYDGWTPETLTDETRRMDVFEDDGESPDFNLDHEVRQIHAGIKWYEDQAKNYVRDFRYKVSPNYHRDWFCVVMFEARAMLEQFRKYTHGLTLCPFGGQPSIEYKWKIAKHIEERCQTYDKPGLVLYFGDCDDAGRLIFEAGREDITAWCEPDLTFIYCGLTENQARSYGIPENLEKPGTFQWEALADHQARQIIENSLAPYFNQTAEDMARQQSDFITGAILERLT
jgi:hypothetical protein